MGKITLLLICILSFLGCSYLGIEDSKIPDSSTTLVSHLEQEELVPDIEQEVIDESDPEEQIAQEDSFEEEEEYSELKPEKEQGFFASFFGGEDEGEELVEDEEGYEYLSDDIETEVIDGQRPQTQVARGEEEYEDEEYQQEQEEEFVFNEPSSQKPKLKKNIPLQKIKITPYSVGSYLVNGVYIARQGDSLASISQKIYAQDETKQLNMINPHLKSRALVVGDKIYYNSPRRPTDQSRILFYYEDMGLQPQMHRIQPGQNIRTISTQLLGHQKSWKEIWATNPQLISKWQISQEVMISYWPQGAMDRVPPPPLPQEPLAQAEPPALPEEEPPALPEAEEEANFPQESEDFAHIEPPAPAPPPAPPSEVLPEKNMEKKNIIALLKGFYMSQDKVAYLWQEKKLLAGFLVGLFVLYLILKIILRKRQKETEFDYTSPNIEI